MNNSFSSNLGRQQAGVYSSSNLSRVMYQQITIRQMNRFYATVKSLDRKLTGDALAISRLLPTVRHKSCWWIYITFRAGLQEMSVHVSPETLRL